MADSIETLRGKIREVDYKILRLVKQRLQLALEVGEVKSNSGLPIVNLDVEKSVIARALVWSEELGLDNEFTEKIVKMLIAEAIRVEEDSLKERQ